MKKVFIKTIRLYQRVLSPDTGLLKKYGLTNGSHCPFFPTCSEYTINALEKYGLVKGTIKGIYRILRCHPWQKGGIDPA